MAAFFAILVVIALTGIALGGALNAAPTPKTSDPHLIEWVEHNMASVAEALEQVASNPEPLPENLAGLRAQTNAFLPDARYGTYWTLEQYCGEDERQIGARLHVLVKDRAALLGILDLARRQQLQIAYLDAQGQSAAPSPTALPGTVQLTKAMYAMPFIGCGQTLPPEPPPEEPPEEPPPQ